MKRDISELQTWEEFEKELFKRKGFKEVADALEYEYVIADKLLTLRKEQNLSQAQLAKKIGTKQPVISRIENGSVKPSLDILERIAHALNLKLQINFV